MTAALIKAAVRPVVTDTGPLDDRAWFAQHPNRLFRYRRHPVGGWLIRRRRYGGDTDAYLRTFTTALTPPSDVDSELAALWYRAAYPDWPPERCQKFTRKAIKRRCE